MHLGRTHDSSASGQIVGPGPAQSDLHPRLSSSGNLVRQRRSALLRAVCNYGNEDALILDDADVHGFLSEALVANVIHPRRPISHDRNFGVASRDLIRGVGENDRPHPSHAVVVYDKELARHANSLPEVD